MNCLHILPRLLLLWILGFFISTASNAQSLHSTYLNNKDGLSNNFVYSIFQDHNGFMWVGTYDGLNRYDGYEFTVFRNIINDSTSIFSNTINSVGEDENYNIWIGGQKEVNIYNPVTGRFSVPSYALADNTVKARINDNVTSIQRIGHHVMLAGTLNLGLFYFDKSAPHGRQVLLPTEKQPISHYYVTAIKYDAAKDIAYILVQGIGLYTYDVMKHCITLKIPLAQAFCMDIGDNGDIWLGNNSGLYRLNPETNTISESLINSTASVVSICHDKNGTVWIGTDGNGLWSLPAGQQKAQLLSSSSRKETQPLVNSNAIYAICEDRQQRKWVGTLRGGVSIIEPQFDIFKKVKYGENGKNTTVDNFIFCFNEAPGKNVWIGTDGAGLRYWNRADNTFTNFVHDNNVNSISSNFITSMVSDGSHGLWISTWCGGVNYFDYKTRLFKRYDCINPDTKALNNNVWSLLKDSHERLWACAVRNGGLYLFNHARQRFEMFDNRFLDMQVLTEDREGNIWGGDYQHLIKIDTATKQHQLYSIGYTVRSIYEDKRHDFWVGTQEGGLLLFNRKTGGFKRFTTREGLPHNTVLNIQEDSLGNLWLSTYNGLSKFTPSTHRFRNFSQADGLLSNQLSFHGAAKLSTGEMLCGSVEGFNIFSPQAIADNTSAPPLFLSTLNVNNKPVQNNLSYITETSSDIIRSITIPFNEASLSLGFLGIDYSDAGQLHYAYNLKGWDKGWNYVKNSRTANYSRLQEGKYVFEVKVSRASGEWSQPVELLHITVLPPWYRSWWAYLLYTLLFISVTYIWLLYKNRQTKLQYEIKLAHLETQQEKELNEKKIAFFTNVSHEFRAPLSLIINPVKELLQGADNPELRIVYRNAQRLLRLVDHLLLFKKAEAEDSLNLSKLNLATVLKNVYDCFTDQAKRHSIQFEFRCGPEPLFVEADEEKIEIVFFNILSNAFKYTPRGGRIIFMAEEENGKLKVSISDNGSGIDAGEGEKVFRRFYQAKNGTNQTGFGIGLYLAKTFVNAHGGTISYNSKTGEGTTFIINLNLIPAAITEADISQSEAHRTPDESDENTANSTVTEPVVEKRHAADIIHSSSLKQMSTGITAPQIKKLPQELTTEKQSLLLVDDDIEMLDYLARLFKDKYRIYTADCAEDGIQLAHEHLPDLIVSDIVMKGLNGLDLCSTLKEEQTVSHIPVILLTGTSSDEVQLKAMEKGADDYIKKPFDKDLLAARVKVLLNRRNILQNYFYNEVTLGTAKYKVSAEYKEFLEKCMAIIENHLENDQFSIKVLAREMGISHTVLYKRVKSVSGQTLAGFIKFIRLRKAAGILINTECNINETASQVGFTDIRYFRNQFSKQFGMTPSEYIKKYRKSFHNVYSIDDDLKSR